MDVVMIVGSDSATLGLCEQLVVSGYVVCAAEQAACMIDALERGVRPVVIAIDEAAPGAAELVIAARALGVRFAPLPRETPERGAAELLGASFPEDELRAAS
jgi:hypothetical protein